MAKILLIESNPLAAEAMSQQLAGAGYAVFISLRGGDAALQIARREEPNLILLDAAMPGADGPTICKMLRRVSNAALILLTRSHPSPAEAAEFDADDYLIKPIDPAELFGRVRVALRRVNGRQGARLQSSDLELDLVSRRAYLNSEEVKLSHKEFELLATLLRHKGTVLSRSFLIDRAWGDQFARDPRTVDVHIRWLREKIERDPSNPTRLQTVRGVGYRMD